MLHILNGSAMEETMRQSGIDGDLFSFRDALIAGPVPDVADKYEWRTIRAKHLSQTYEVEFDECAIGLLEQENVLQSYGDHDEVIMWFEHDLFCQLNLLYLLDWFAKVDLRNTTLSLVNIGAFPGRDNFRGLGELNSTELVSLFPQREKISREHQSVGSEAWNTFRSNDPTSIERLLRTDTSVFPFLKTALTSHLRRFPATHNGLGEIERSALEIVDRGLHRFNELFPVFANKKAVYGLGDSQVWLSLVDMTHGPEPLITSEGTVEPGEVSFETSFVLTDAGKSVLSGESDFIKLNGIDRWLGGVHLEGHGEMFRWDAGSEKLMYC